MNIMRYYSTLAVLMLVFFSACRKDLQQAEHLAAAEQNSAKTITAVPDPYFDSLFTRYGGGWTGGDVGYSHLLPDGRVMWLWGDSFLDTVYPNRRRPVVPFIHNSITITDDAGNFTTFHGGSEKNPKAFFPSKDPKIYWTNSAFLSKDKKYAYILMANIFNTNEGGIFGFKFRGSSVGLIELSTMTKIGVKDFSMDSIIDWTATTLEEENYVYIYGAESTKYTKFAHVCRTSVNNPMKKIEYFDGTNWTTDAKKSSRLLKGVSEQFSVFNYQNKYYLLTQEGFIFSPDIYLYDAASPVGPFTNKRKVYTTPQTGGNIITYNAVAHPQYIKDGQLLISYSVNSTDGRDLYKNADNYRPYFVRLSGWQ